MSEMRRITNEEEDAYEELRAREDEDRARMVARVRKRSRAGESAARRAEATRKKKRKKRKKRKHNRSLQEEGHFAQLKAEENKAFDELHDQHDADRAAARSKLENRLKRGKTFRNQRRGTSVRVKQ